MKKSVKEINTVGLIVKDLSNKKKWVSLCVKNEKLIKSKLNKDKKFKGLILDILYHLGWIFIKVGIQILMKKII